MLLNIEFLELIIYYYRYFNIRTAYLLVFSTFQFINWMNLSRWGLNIRYNIPSNSGGRKNVDEIWPVCNPRKSATLGRFRKMHSAFILNPFIIEPFELRTRRQREFLATGCCAGEDSAVIRAGTTKTGETAKGEDL